MTCVGYFCQQECTAFLSGQDCFVHHNVHIYMYTKGNFFISRGVGGAGGLQYKSLQNSISGWVYIVCSVQQSAYSADIGNVIQYVCVCACVKNMQQQNNASTFVYMYIHVLDVPYNQKFLSGEKFCQFLHLLSLAKCFTHKIKDMVTFTILVKLKYFCNTKVAELDLAKFSPMEIFIYTVLTQTGP